MKPAQQSNSNSGKSRNVTTLHSRDSQEGSRVAISSDQSLNNYEAYRRGDHFYVKIPAADVPRPEAVRGRGFADVKALRTGDSTVLSFRLQPGATAHVEQRANKLDVVVTVPGSASGVQPDRVREPARSSAGDQFRSGQPNLRGTTPKTANKNEASRTNSSAAGPTDLNLNKKSASPASASAKATPTPAPTPSPKSSPTPKSTATPPGQKASVAKASPTASPVTQTTQPNAPRNDFWSRTKERAGYWILLAQLNPIPVAIGAALLVLIIGLLLFQRRRAKATRRARPAAASAAKSTRAPVIETPPVTPTPEPPPIAEAAMPLATAAAVASTAPEGPAVDVPAAVVAPVPMSSAVDDGRRERVNRVADEAKKLFEGAEYDEAIVGSEDRDTRRLVGAELLSALVGRNPVRRERAREAFMKHGYFDDATRDLRVAESDNERAAAARRLSFVRDPEATPHLIGALGDPSPDVRRASIEALMDLRDPAAIGPLNSLMQTEHDRKVPRTLIKHAIEACATSAPDPSSTSLPVSASQPSPPTSQSFETEREVIEI